MFLMSCKHCTWIMQAHALERITSEIETNVHLYILALHRRKPKNKHTIFASCVHQHQENEWYTGRI